MVSGANDAQGKLGPDFVAEGLDGWEVADRVELHAGDLMQGVPEGHGVYTARHVLHMLDDETAAAAHLLQALEDPDVLWYLATKYWVIQLAIPLLYDADLRDELLALVREHAATSSDPQPAWVTHDLEALSETSNTQPAAATLDIDAAIVVVREALTVIAEGDD